MTDPSSLRTRSTYLHSFGQRESRRSPGQARASEATKGSFLLADAPAGRNASRPIRYELYYADDSERPFLAFATWSDAADAAMNAVCDGQEIEVYDTAAGAIVGRFR